MGSEDTRKDAGALIVWAAELLVDGNLGMIGGNESSSEPHAADINECQVNFCGFSVQKNRKSMVKKCDYVQPLGALYWFR